MARIRNIKPAFFKDSELFDAEAETGLPLRVAYAGLWTVADRAGRFKWKPREIQTDVLPYDKVDMGDVLDALVRCGKIFKYKCAGFDYGYIPNFEKHQFINKNELKSQLPEPPTNSNAQSKIVSNHVLLVLSDTDTDGLTQTQDSTAQAPSPKPVRKVTTSLPENFPTAADTQAACAFWAERARQDLVDLVQDEAFAFRAHHAAHGSRMADWGQAWVTWYSKAIKFNRKPTDGKRQSSHDNHNAGTVLYLEKLARESRGQGENSDPPDTPRKLLLAP